jgi:hypothetical protein
VGDFCFLYWKQEQAFNIVQVQPSSSTAVLIICTWLGVVGDGIRIYKVDEEMMWIW